MREFSGQAAMRALLAVPLLFVLVLIACEDVGATQNRCRQAVMFRQDPTAYYDRCVECGGPEKVQAERNPSTQQLTGRQCR